MGISRITAMKIRNTEEKDLEIVVSDKPETNGKYVCALWRTDYSPSGCERPELLLEYALMSTPEKARKFLTDVVAEIRGMTDEQLYGPKESRPEDFPT